MNFQLYQYDSSEPHEKKIFQTWAHFLFNWRECQLACIMGKIKIISHNVRLRVDEIKHTINATHSWHGKA